MTSSELPEEFFVLLERAIEGELSLQEAGELDELVKTSDEARRAYVRYTHMHATLHWRGVSVDSETNRQLVLADPPTSIAAPARWLVPTLTVITALSLLIAAITAGGRQQSGAPIVATLVSSAACTWGEGSLPTKTGASLTAGIVHLKSGLAKIRFSSGAEVSLEAPAELEIIDEMRCVLHEGALVAHVPERAVGFRVDTLTAELIDQGTDFGVIVNRDRHTTDVNVFDGMVDVMRNGVRERHRLQTGDRSVIDADSVTLIDSDDEFSESNPDSVDPFVDAIPISTTELSEGFVRKTIPRAGIFRKMFFLKTSANKPQYNSKIYLQFDLRSVDVTRIGDAKLQLQLMHSPRGFASLVPDATFAVYAVTTDEKDAWTRDTLSWDTAPGNAESPEFADESCTRLLGKFEIPQGVQSGFFGVDGKALTETIMKDGNQQLTLFVVRETSETDVRGLAHAFARASSPKGVAPTLFLSLTDE